MNPDADRKQAATDAIREALNARGQKTREQLEARLSEAVQDAVAALTEPPDLPDDLFAAPEAASTDDAVAVLRDAIDQMATGEDQVAILNLLVDLCSSFADRVALFVARRENAVGWRVRGFGTTDVRNVTLAMDGGSLLAQAASSGDAACMDDPSLAAPVWEALGSDGAPAALALPLSVKERVVAILFCDGSPGSLQIDALAILARVAEISLGAVALRGRTVSRVGSNVERRPSQSWEPSRPQAQLVQADTPPSPAAPAFEPPAFQPPESSGEAEMAAAAQPMPDVNPDGTHDAVAQEGSANADPQEEAKRFARLLVSEILLYNEPQITEGKKTADLYRRLKEDLDRSEQMYRQRFGTGTGDMPDYFEEEVVRTLAGGDASLLGPR
jgi:hypothetical protein